MDIMDFDFETYMPDWDGDWCGTGPKLPLPEPDPWPEHVVASDDLVHLEPAAELGKTPVDGGFLAPFAADVDMAIGGVENEDRLGNHEIQRLMQIMNQNDTLEDNVREKMNDTENAIIGKI
jgi:hypothetical protein